MPTDSRASAGSSALRPQSLLARLQTLLLPLALALCAWKLIETFGGGAAIKSWLFWRYLGYWALAAYWTLGCLCFGHALLRRLLGPPLPILEHVTLCGAIGTLAFFLSMFAFGLAMAYGPVLFVALPGAMLALGLYGGAFRYVRRLIRHLRAARGRVPRRLALGSKALWALGIIALFLLYIPSVVPSHVGYDSRWYHVPLGEHYASLGGIQRFPEGWFPGAIAHLSSVIYAWAFLLPHSQLFDRIELSVHLEFMSVLLVLPGIPALVRRMVPGARAHAAWVALFAFPSLYWYDLLIGGDQFSALWSAPIALALLRAYPRLDLRYGLVLACAMAGQVLTKYSSLPALILPVLVIAWRSLWLPLRELVRGTSPRSALGAGAGGFATGGALLLLTTPLWLKNWLWYGDPLHPMLNAYFDSRPWTADASAYYADYLAEVATFAPKRDWAGLQETLRAVIQHAFAPSDFALNPPESYRGALFTLLCLCLPLVRASARLWLIAAVANVAVFGWYWQLHQDRYLMAFMPTMAAVIAAIAILAARSSAASRAALVVVIGLHSVWGLNVFTLSRPQENFAELLRFITAARSRGIEAGMGAFTGWQAIGASMPPDGKLLIHHQHLHTGLGRASVSDWPRLQTGIAYGRYPSAAAMYRSLRQMGITHMAWSRDQPWLDESIAGDLRFNEFGAKYTDPQPIGELVVGRLPDRPPPEEHDEPWIAFLACRDSYKPGLYRFSDMTVPTTRYAPAKSFPKPRQPLTPESDLAPALARAKFAVFDPSCGFALPEPFAQEFLQIGRRATYVLYARRGIP